jgi:formate-dependent nitrite reductase membrane component NrfD
VLAERANEIHWTWMIYTEMFLAGVAAGVVICALLLAIGGRGRSSAARTANLLAFPLLLAVTVLLIVDLGRPERFWHMIVMSERYIPAIKPWSPISLGTWLIMAFSGFSFISFLHALFGGGWASALEWREGAWSRVGAPELLWRWLGVLLGLAVAIYAGVLLSVTNIPGWADSPMIPAVYAASAPVTGIALLILVEAIRGRANPDILRLAATNTALIAFWLLVTIVFVATLVISFNGSGRYFLQGWPLLAIVGAIVLGGVIPLLLRLRRAYVHRAVLIVSSVLVLVGGLLLRMGIVMGPQQWLH